MSKSIFVAIASDNRILGTFLASGPALSFASAQLSGDTNSELVVEFADATFHNLSPRKFKALTEGMSQGQCRTFKVYQADDSEELTQARLALSNAEKAIASLPMALPEAIVDAQLSPLRAAVAALESASEGDAPFITIQAHAPLRRAYGTIADAEEPEASEEPAAPESASERAASFRKSVGLK